MATKRFFFTLISVLSLTCAVTAQNLSQQEANTFLAGTWHAGSQVLTFNDNGGARSAVIDGDAYTYWSIYTNTFDFSSGSLQATNSSPQRNISLKYRSLTRSTCEFYLNGSWVSASKGSSSVTVRPSTNGSTSTRPAVGQPRPDNNNATSTRPAIAQPRPDNNNATSTRPAIAQPRPDNNNATSTRPAIAQPRPNNNNATSTRPATAQPRPNNNNATSTRPAVSRPRPNNNNATSIRPAPTSTERKTADVVN